MVLDVWQAGNGKVQRWLRKIHLYQAKNALFVNLCFHLTRLKSPPFTKVRCDITNLLLSDKTWLRYLNHVLVLYCTLKIGLCIGIDADAVSFA